MPPISFPAPPRTRSASRLPRVALQILAVCRRPRSKAALLGVLALGGAALGGCRRSEHPNASLADKMAVLGLPVAHRHPVSVAVTDAAAFYPPRPPDAPVARDARDEIEPPLTAAESQAFNALQPRIAAQSPAAPTTLPPFAPIPRSKVTPGRGLAICDPVVTGATVGENKQAMQDFGAGCTRWLHFQVGGLEALGTTPVWESPERVKKELNRSDYRLTAADVPRLFPILGVTHAATSEIAGSPASCTLTYQLLTVPDARPMGEPLRVSGTQAQVAAALPDLARWIAARLGVTGGSILAAPAPDGGDIAALGALPWTADTGLTAAQRQAAFALAPRLAPAGMLLLSSRVMENATAERVVTQTLLQQAPDNALLLAEAAPHTNADAQEITQAIRAGLTHYPDSYLLMAARVRQARSQEGRSRADELAAVQRATQCAPNNPNVWLSLANTCSSAASAIRKGRFASAMSGQEWNALNALYPRALVAAQKATVADPQNAGAWYKVAEAATFAGEEQTASAAFWKSVALDQTDAEVYAWGLQMFQEKWGGSPQLLTQVADAAAAAPLPNGAARRRVIASLLNADCKPQAAAMQARWTAAAQALLARDPNNAQAHYDLAEIEKTQDIPQRATREYKTVVRLRPDDPRAHYDLAENLYHSSRFKESIVEFRETLRLRPLWGEARCDLGWALKNDRQFEAAESELQTALGVRMTPLATYNTHLGLAKLVLIKYKYPEAIRECRAAIKADAGYPDAYELLAGALGEAKQFDESIKAGLVAERMMPRNSVIHDRLSYAYIMTNQTRLSVEQCRMALALSPDDLVAHENLGDGLYKLKQKDAARAEWNLVLKLDTANGGAAKEARANLAKLK